MKKWILILILAIIFILGFMFIIFRSNDVTEYREAEFNSIRWKPSGESFSYINRNPYENKDKILYIKNIQSLEKEELLNSGEYRFEYINSRNRPGYAWSPDGNKIAFILRSETDINLRLKIYDLNTNEIITVTDNAPGQIMEWSPDGKTLLLYGRQNKYWIMNTDGTDIKFLFDDSISPKFDQYIYPGVYWFNDPNYLYLYIYDLSIDSYKNANYYLFARFNIKEMKLEEVNTINSIKNECGNPLDSKIININLRLISPDGKLILEPKWAFSIDPINQKTKYILKKNEIPCNPLDTDGDNIPNFKDEDDDGDGFSDYEEINVGTSILDLEEHP